MTTEDVYIAVAEVMESRSLLLCWRIVVESDVRIILEKRKAPSVDKSRDDDRLARPLGTTITRPLASKESHCSGRSRICSDQADLVKKEKVDEVVLDERVGNQVADGDEDNDWIKHEPDADLVDSGGEWGSGRGDSSPENDAAISSFTDDNSDDGNQPAFTAHVRKVSTSTQIRYNPFVALYPCDDLLKTLHDKNNAKAMVETDLEVDRPDFAEMDDSQLGVIGDSSESILHRVDSPEVVWSPPHEACEEALAVACNEHGTQTVTIRNDNADINSGNQVTNASDSSTATADAVCRGVDNNCGALPSSGDSAATSITKTATSSTKKTRLKLNLPRGSYFYGTDAHKRILRRVDKKQCPLCKKINYGNKYLRTHINRCHPGFLTKTEKEEEAKKELAERTCNICSKTLTTKGGYNTHMREIHLRDSLEDRTCPVCGKELSSRRRREEHIAKNHQADRVGGPFPCQYCSKLFTTKDQVRNHIRSTCAMKSNVMECPVCWRKYRHEDAFRYHMLTTHADAGYKPENEQDHKLLNLKATCNVCGKEMKRHSLKHHIAYVHQGIERNLKCPKCEMTFSSPATKNRHMREVHQDLPTRKSCQKCNKTFTNSQGLKNHIRGVHMGIRNQCELCPSSFFSKKDLSEHVNSVHLGNKHQCSHCSRDFNRRSELYRHMRNVHHINTSSETKFYKCTDT